MKKTTNSSSIRPRWEKMLTTGLIVGGILLIVFFGFRSVRSYLRIQWTGLEAGVTNVEMVRGWMTVPYIAKAYNVPGNYIFKQLEIPSEGNSEKSLGQLNYKYAFGERKAILNAVKEAIKQYQAENLLSPKTSHD